ncbi:MAG: dihydroorotase [Waddliaceae bacterium]
MLTIKNIKTLAGKVQDWTIPSDCNDILDAKGELTMLPALVDGHVHFRTPGLEYKEDWITGARAAIAGGVTTVLDMPNHLPPCTDFSTLQSKKKLIKEQLSKEGIPLRYHLYLGAEINTIANAGQLQKDIIGIKVFMGSTTGELLMDDPNALHRVFQLAAQKNLLVSVHAEDESLMRKNKEQNAGRKANPSLHSIIRDRSCAIHAAKQAIQLAEKYSTPLMILHVSTKEEASEIRKAKARGVLVYAEAAPHHLFLTESDYAEWGTFVQVNPPLRTQKDQDALWEAIHDRTIDTIGSDHAPHTREEKQLPYGQAPSGIPGIETMLPLLLNARKEQKISLEQIVSLTRINPECIFRLPRNKDVVLVDLERKKAVCDKELQTKCGWSPYAGRVLTGWPVYTIVQGKVFKVG